jgi:hypothetical protein
VSFLFTDPAAMAAAVGDLTGIGSEVRNANAAATLWTADILPAAGDEVSAAIAAQFGGFARRFQTLAARAADFHEQLVNRLTAASESYYVAEQANTVAVQPLAALVGNTIVMSGTGMPIPSAGFVDAVNNLFIQPNLPGTLLTALTTPEQAYPFTGVRSLPLSASLSQGVQILDQALQPYVSAGTPVGVFGYSQSATIASLEMRALQAAGVPSSAVHFVLIGDPMNPNGGLYARFAGLNLSALGIDFSGATPSDAFPTTIYTAEYDVFADFPRYPLNILADVNALASQTHFSYATMTPGQVAGAVQLPTTPGSLTDYYVIPTQNLPLLDGLRGIPVLGNPVADLLQPDLRYLVNLGYGDPRYGWSTSYADVPTEFGLLPPLSAFEQLPQLLVGGAGQGVHDFLGDFTGTGPHPVTLPSVESLLGSSSGTGGAVPNPLAGWSFAPVTPSSLQAGIGSVATSVSSSLSHAYSVLLPTADIVNDALISVPAYDVNLFLDGIDQALNGAPLTGLVNAVYRPLAADIALYLLLASFEGSVLTG